MERSASALSERATRKQFIDKLLASCGWRVTPFVQDAALAKYDRCALEEYPTSNGPADYALVLGGKIVGVVEAKKLTIGPQNVLSQAARYSCGLQQHGFSWQAYGVPFLYSTNGEVLWFHDVRDERNRSRQV